jgi:hypothetical protein
MLKFHLKLPFLAWVYMFCIALTMLFINITTYSNYRVELNTNKAVDFYNATQFDFEIYNVGVHFLLPIILFLIQKTENRNLFANRMNFYPIKKSKFYLNRVAIYYILSIPFSIVFFLVVSLKYNNFHHLGLFPLFQSFLICKKIIFIQISGIPHILLITVFSFVFENFLFGILSHLVFQMMSHFSRAVYFLPSVWPNLTAEFFGKKPMSYTHEFPYYTVFSFGIIFALLVLGWVTKFFNIRYYGKI